MVQYILSLMLFAAMGQCQNAAAPPAQSAPAPQTAPDGIPLLDRLDTDTDTDTDTELPAQPVPATAPQAAPEVIALLDRLATAADGLSTFTAGVYYVVEDDLGGDVKRRGDIVYQVDENGRRIGILFNSRIANNRKRDDNRSYLFSGIWLVEIDYEQKLFIKRQIARPGTNFDPLELGRGPFPLPIGQPRGEVLKRFTVSLVDLPTEGPLAKLAGGDPLDGLHLVPLPGSQAARDFVSVDLFYDRATGLPVGVRMIKERGARIETARFDHLKRNPVLTAELLARLSIEEPDPTEWRIDVRPMAK